MKGDFSRSTFDPRKHYRGVRMQQGRVQLDADWNENLDILLHRIETEARDVIGECGVPVHDGAFEVIIEEAMISGDAVPATELRGRKRRQQPPLREGDFYLSRGRAYVDGILVENDHTVPFSRQPFVLHETENLISEPGIYLLYLDVWERHITELEDPDIREKALGGPDTTTRTQVIWQAVLSHIEEADEQITCKDNLRPWPDPSNGTLIPRLRPEETPEDPCVIGPRAGYRCLENQLYRVEIHRGSNNKYGPTFKWSRDNGSVVVPITEFSVDDDSHRIRVFRLGRDSVLELHENDWVEIQDDAHELAGNPGILALIEKIDPGNILTLSESVTGYHLYEHPKVRRWDSSKQLDVAIPRANDGFIPLEGGIEIKFSGGTFHTGDYWLIPARTVPGQYGDIEWPVDSVTNSPLPLLPFGIAHHYCMLAILSAQVDDNGNFAVMLVEDCRKKFPPLTELPAGGSHCCSVTVGQCGDFPDLRSALAARPPDADWWTICILPGQLSVDGTVTVYDASNLTIRGCGNQCHILGPLGEPVFIFNNGQNIRLEEVCIHANDLVGLPAVQVNGQEISILGNHIRGGGIKIIPPSKGVRIEDNIITTGAGPGIQLGGGDKTAVDFAGMRASVGFSASRLSIRTGDVAGTHGSKSANPSVAGIQCVTISNNLIAEMMGSGIITETSFAGPSEAGDVETVTITGNKITNCCKAPEVDLGGMKVGGGIATMGLFSAQITDNFIANNGGMNQPACGILVFDGGNIDITGNTVVENGWSEVQLAPGSYQAGIAALFVFGNLLTWEPSAGRDLGSGGYPAVRIQGNRVICPAGQALCIVSMGSVVVDGNTLTSREWMQWPEGMGDLARYAGLGACVSVLDFGTPIWFQDYALLLRMISTGQTTVHMENSRETNALISKYPDGRVLFHNNQVTFSSVQQAVTQSSEQKDSEWYLDLEQHTFSAFFMSLDSISLNGNQFQASVPQYAMRLVHDYQLMKGGVAEVQDLSDLCKFIHVASAGTVVQAASNCLSEPLLSTIVSYASLAAFMNITTNNEAVHGFVTSVRVGSKKVEKDNLSLQS
ncbi:MAG: right-handed parallel beta-helix repeat-containing protein [Anaerolineae bacterium]|nr:right-handed parallel beta-helix repeat-containing protein [Anaerolineae bacterium]